MAHYRCFTWFWVSTWNIKLNSMRHLITTMSQWGCSARKRVLKYFAKCIRKRLCQSLFFNKVAGLKLLLLQFPFNTLSSRNLDPKPRKCVFKFKVWWRREPSLSIVWRQNAINFDWKCWFTSLSLKIIVKKRFHNWFWAQRKKTSF